MSHSLWRGNESLCHKEEYMNPNYISDVVDIKSINYFCLNLIEAPPGSGKTFFALEKLCHLASNKAKVIYLIDSVAGGEQIAQHPNASLYTKEWRQNLSDGLEELDDGKINVMTYAKFGALLKFYPDFINEIELIICDELQNIFWPIAADRAKITKQFPMMTNKEVNDLLSKTSYNYIALDRLQWLCCDETCFVVALTATPRKVYDNFTAEINDVTLDCELVAYETMQRIYYRNLQQELLKLEHGKQYIVYVPLIAETMKYLNLVRKRGFEANAIWSCHNKDHPMTEEQLKLRSYVIDRQAIPDDLEVLFINKSCETSINIFGNIDAMYIHCGDEDVVTQARGRFRGSLERLYVYKQDIKTVVIPDEFLNVPLYTEDKERLSHILNILDKGGRLCKWNTIKSMLPGSGFKLTESRKEGRRVSVITKSDEAW